MRKLILKKIYQYIFSDIVSAILAWFVFLVYRKKNNDFLSASSAIQSMVKQDYVVMLVLIPIFWFIIYTFSGAYFNPYRKSRLNEIYRTITSSFLGVIILFFVFVLNDNSKTYNYYTNTFLFYFIFHIAITSLFRTIVLNTIKKDFRRKKFYFNTLIIGGNAKAIKIYKDIIENNVELGYKFKGFVYAEENSTNGMSSYLPKLGSITELEKIIDENQIEEVIIAVDTSEHNKLQQILSMLSHRPLVIKITPDMYDIISGSVRTNNVFGAVMIEIYPELMPDWQRVIKRFLDISISILVLFILSPLYLFAILKVKLSSKGTIFYRQKRIGLYGKPFNIFKFRSMYMDAENGTPALSSKDDPRITPWGKFMRKWRIDELPQFFNILKGDMSLVGPRPERKYFIDIICQTHPHYKYLHKVKPGLSSWGMVKYGYAENVDEMKERMQYDLLYIENCSLALDFKIMIYTLLVILQGRGK